jgi:hypothetical protein
LKQKFLKLDMADKKDADNLNLTEYMADEMIQDYRKLEGTIF